MQDHSVTFNLGSAKVCSLAKYGTYFSYHNILIAATDYYICFYLILLFH